MRTSTFIPVSKHGVLLVFYMLLAKNIMPRLYNVNLRCIASEFSELITVSSILRTGMFINILFPQSTIAEVVSAGGLV